MGEKKLTAEQVFCLLEYLFGSGSNFCVCVCFPGVWSGRGEGGVLLTMELTCNNIDIMTISIFADLQCELNGDAERRQFNWKLCVSCVSGNARWS